MRLCAMGLYVTRERSGACCPQDLLPALPSLGHSPSLFLFDFGIALRGDWRHWRGCYNRRQMPPCAEA